MFIERSQDGERMHAQVHMREVSAEGEEVIKTGKLYLVDLAGSENVNRYAPAINILLLIVCSLQKNHGYL